MRRTLQNSVSDTVPVTLRKISYGCEHYRIMPGPKLVGRHFISQVWIRPSKPLSDAVRRFGNCSKTLPHRAIGSRPSGWPSRDRIGIGDTCDMSDQRSAENMLQVLNEIRFAQMIRLSMSRL